jgi:hypothetical protein
MPPPSSNRVSRRRRPLPAPPRPSGPEAAGPARAGDGGAAAAPPLRERLFEPVDAASLAVFRIGFGLLMVWHVLHYFADQRLERYYLTPVLLGKFYGLSWVEPWPEPWLRAHFWALAGLALLIALGLFYRVACALFVAGYTYVFLLNEVEYLNHTYLICLLAFLMIVVPAHRAYALDAARRPGRAATVPRWALWLLRFQVAVPYVYGGLAKLNHDWLVRAEPMGMWLREGTEGPFQAAFLAERWAAYALSWGGALYDLLIVPALLWRRTRLAAFLLTLGFHLLNSRLFEIGVFPWLMIAAALLFFPPDWPRRLPGLRSTPAGLAPAPETPVPARARRRVLAGLAVYVAVQLLVPLRHYLYPGNVDWTEEGHQFAWRMKLRDKRGRLDFVAMDPARGKVYPLAGTETLLGRAQYVTVVHDPQLIRQLAHVLAERLRAAGYGDPEVRALTAISLNGRPPQPLVDPEVDLSALDETLGPAPWIVPLRD